MNWSNVYQDINQAQTMNNMLLNQMNNNMEMFNNNSMNNMNMNFMGMNNNPLAQIQMISNMIQNNCSMISGGNFMNNNFNNMSMINQNQNDENSKVNLCFSTIAGARIMMAFNPNETVEGALTKFLRRCNLDRLIGKINKELTFLLSGQSLKFGDKRKLKDAVLMPLNVTNILVIDTNNLIGA